MQLEERVCVVLLDHQQVLDQVLLAARKLVNGLNKKLKFKIFLKS
jgi:hypothetical protein